MYIKIATRIALLPLLLMLCQCDKIQAITKPKPAPPTPYDFHLALEFTPAAEAKMKARQDNIVISTFYYGHARPEYMAKADELHRLELGYKEVAFKGTARNVVINSSAMAPGLLPQTTEGEPYVLITVSTETTRNATAQDGPHLRFLPSDKASQASALPDPETEQPGQRIECRSYTGPVKALQTTLHTLTCDIATP